MRKRSEEESAGRMEWVEKNVRSDLRQANTSWSAREGVQGGSENRNVVRAGDGGTDEKTEGDAGGGRVEDFREE